MIFFQVSYNIHSFLLFFNEWPSAIHFFHPLSPPLYTHIHYQESFFLFSSSSFFSFFFFFLFVNKGDFQTAKKLIYQNLFGNRLSGNYYHHLRRVLLSLQRVLSTLIRYSYIILLNYSRTTWYQRKRHSRLPIQPIEISFAN